MLLSSRKWSSIHYGYADALRLLLKTDTIRFGVFFGTLVGTYRIAQLLLVLVRGDTEEIRLTNRAIAGKLYSYSVNKSIR